VLIGSAVSLLVALSLLAAADAWAIGQARPAAGESPPATVLKVTLGSLKVAIDSNTGRGTLGATCQVPLGQACTFEGKLSASVTALRAHARQRARTPAAKQIGTVAGTLPGGHVGQLTVKLTRSALSVLRHHVVPATLAATASYLATHVRVTGRLQLMLHRRR